ncbi:MAG: endopeptidase La [Turicibacter sp.]|jgi:ATP-dependent Lon protease|uniref:Lon protease n=1 Tax=Turicibacter faecis TaxID=2963365 RepID=A0ABN6ZBF3_9FIRM|nr:MULTISPECIES: endopeptidase La [unclassified Turicibacter]MCI8700800.1 endopeptidase La [Turicibacter sp.]BEH91156.1 Lon protease [Turicibacter sp. TC023]MCI9350917.1 endopeptidase La [Turicibacter sp.]MCU7204247.1 endopeptidase La [Turicibacter sp. TA25]MCU7209372.1 endopeptidase La [Turicibacter sp. 1E2]
MRIDVNNVEVHTLPVLPVRGVVSLPNTEVRLEIGRLQSIEALEACEANGNYVALVSQIDPNVERPQSEDLCHYGTIAKITMKIKLPNGHYKVKFNSITRIEIEEYTQLEPYFEARVQTMPSLLTNSDKEEAMLRLLKEEIAEHGSLLFAHPTDVASLIDEAENAIAITDIIAFYLRISEEDKMKYLSMPSVEDRLSALLKEVEKEKHIAQLELKINQEVKRALDEHQKEFYLREKMKAIQKELGDEYSKEAVSEEFREKVQSLGMPHAVKEKALEEIKRFEMLPANSSESGVVRTYLEWLVALPWSVQTEDNKDILFAEETLNKQHYGLEKVKERILEYLAVKTMTGKNPSTILCLVGPPGVGKTSLARSIAEALGRKFVKVSLGGVKDESEIRGHRRTYLGALPGRLIQAMKKAGTINPVFLLDEIDKMASDHKGDPASAMLEVLDPEQNSHFSDHYLEEEYDLSQVLFVATANYLENIPAPLRDRMDIIHVDSYTEQEKFQIAIRYLIPRQLEIHGLTAHQLTLTDEVVMELIQHYTREAGVRQLERLIGSICRKTARKLLGEGIDRIHVDSTMLKTLLGKHKFTHGLLEEQDQIGVVTGLAYTQFGGDILPVEVTYYKGTGKMVLTGKLGDVMKESAQTAISYVRANAERLNIDPLLFKDHDIHIHVPEGATPKDGPSAGVTMTTALVSALSKKPVKREVGMTGEVTLRGRVLPIGGLKEKTISAHRAGLKVVIMPKDNEKDLEDIPKCVKDEMIFIPVSTVDEVLQQALR